MTSHIDGNMFVAGTLSATSLLVSSNSVTNSHVSSAAAIEASKLQHQFNLVHSQALATIATNERRLVHRCYGATATIVGFRIGPSVAAIGDSTVAFNLLKNGTSVLSGGTAITLTSATSAYTVVAGTVTTTSVSQGDVIEVTIVGTAGTGTLPYGVFCHLILREDAA